MPRLQRIYNSHGRDKLTQQEVIVAYLWEVNDWVPTHELVKLSRPYGHTGSDGDRRARELAANDCDDKLKNKVVSEEGKKLGLDGRYTYFRYEKRPSKMDYVAHSRELVAWFNAL